MSMIIRQMMQYAFDNNLVLTNEFANVKVNSKMFVKKRKPEDYTQVFLVGEQEKIEEEIMKDLEVNDRNVVPLAIYLNFQLGLRACELATIKFSDIHDKYIHIERMEVKDYVLQDDGTTKYNGLKVVPYTKSYAGDREIYLTNKARDIISLVKSINLKHEYLDEDYIFINPYGNRASCNNIMKQIEKYCYRIGIPAKRVHKIRKTYISTLIDNSININKIRETVGHEDERTTLGNYTFNRLSDNETEQAFENALKL